jgi:U3 small nucleolar RNA-associated protein 25
MCFLIIQNWDHLLHVFDHLHLQPREAHGTNFARVRSWALNGWSKYYRQTLLFSSVMLPELNAVMSRKCHNYAGKICVVNPEPTGTVCHVVVQLPQVRNCNNTCRLYIYYRQRKVFRSSLCTEQCIQ